MLLIKASWMLLLLMMMKMMAILIMVIMKMLYLRTRAKMEPLSWNGARASVTGKGLIRIQHYLVNCLDS